MSIARTGDVETPLETRIAELERLTHWLEAENKKLANYLDQYSKHQETLAEQLLKLTNALLGKAKP